MNRRRQRGSQGLVQYVLFLLLLVGGIALVQFIREAPERERAAAEEAAKRQAAARQEAERKAAQRAQQAEAARQRRERAPQPAPAPPRPQASIGGTAPQQNESAPLRVSPLQKLPAVSEWKRATLKPSAALDLESGEQAAAHSNQRDIWWRARSATDLCLCPYPSGMRFRFAQIDPAKFESIDANALAALDYAADGFEHSESASVVRPGLAFAVRTQAGNFAKLRVRSLAPGNVLELDWQLFSGESGALAEVIAANPSLAIVDLTVAMRSAHRRKDRVETDRLLERIEALVEKYPAGDVRRIEQRRDLGWMYYVSGQRGRAIAVFSVAIADIERAARAGREVPWDLANSTYRFLGTVYRAERRDKEAIAAFAQSVAQVERARPGNERESRLRDQSLGRDLYELGSTQCRAGQDGAALISFSRVLQTCASLGNAASTWFCKPERLRCNSPRPGASVR